MAHWTFCNEADKMISEAELILSVFVWVGSPVAAAASAAASASALEPPVSGASEGPSVDSSAPATASEDSSCVGSDGPAYPR